MNKKPYIHKGRFYNDEKENLVYRMFEMFRNFSRTVFLELITGKAKKNFWADCSDKYRWIEPTSFKGQEGSMSVMWLGHSTFLIRLGGLTIMIDPVFFDVSSLLPRYVHVPMSLDQLPDVDVILISHDHADHLDIDSLRVIYRRGNPFLLVGKGLKSWLERLGFERVFEFSWSESITIPRSDGTTKCTFLPAIHWAGRGFFDINKRLWGSWLVEHNDQRIYFAGDTSYGPHFADLKKQFGPIDIAIMPIGPNEPHEKLLDSHVCAYEAVKAFIDTGAKHFIPMHWGTFKVCLDSFLLPIKRLEEAWKANQKALQDKQLHVLKFGQLRQIAYEYVSIAKHVMGRHQQL